ncbi:MAG: MFS transporter [Pedobacter sp.]|nr:MAG: MFS transporter [Pedobacter sp.]
MKKYIPWLVLFLVFIATGLSFLDRQVLSMTIIKIQKELNISDVQYGFVNTSFLISYAIMFTLSGWIIDKVGGKIGLAFSVGIWSIASALHGVMNSFYHLLAFRFLLGAGEGGCFPGAAKTVYEWFGEKHRALAMGIAIGGSAIGAVVAPPLTILISEHYGWRWGFILPGIVGIVWVVVWLAIPWKKKVITDTETIAPKKTSPALLKLLKNKEVLTFVGIRFMLDPVMYFIMFWTPKYLSEQRNVPFTKIGELFWIPFLALGLSNILGGWLSDQLIRKNFSVNKARKIVMGIAAALTLFMPLITFTSSITLAISLMTLMMFAHGFWITNYITAISDVFGSKGTSSVVGLSGTAGAVAGLIINPLMGAIVQNYSYDPLWIASGLMYPLAFVVLIIFIPQLKKQIT